MFCAAVLPVRAALVVHLPYDHNSAANAGALGSAHDGTLEGGAVFTTEAALGNGALALDAAASSYVSHGFSPLGGATPRTVSIWTKNRIAPGDGQRSLLGFGSTAGSPNGSKMDFDVDASASPQGVGRLEIGLNGGRTSPTYTSPGVNNDQWTLVTFTWSPDRGASMNGGRFFVNGSFVYAPSPASPVVDTLADAGSAFNVGKSANDPFLGPGVQQHFNGLLDDVAIWDETLSETEVRALYQMAVEPALKYDAGQFQQLRALFLAGSGSVMLGARSWSYATNLPATEGLLNTAAGYVLVLDATNRTGVANWAQVPPVLLTQPASATNLVGASVTFTNYALGAQPLSYQWYFSDAPLAGATGPTFTRNPLELAHAGPYFVVVSNLYGATTSSVATLTVLGTTPPFITANPTNTTVVKGQPLTLWVGADGTPPLQYQWRKNGMAVGGASFSPSYNLSSAGYSDAGKWDVIVSNPLGSVTSAVAVVTVLDVTSPVINNAADLAVTSAGPGGTVVSLDHVSATDDKDGAIPVTLSPPSGSLFPPGVTVVKAAATDGSGNAATAYFTVSVLATVAWQTNFLDTFTVSAASSDINAEYSAPGRQAGVLSPLRWSEPLGFDRDGANDDLSHLGDAGTLVFSPFTPGANLVLSSPAHDFLESPTYAIEFDVIPPQGDAGNSWAGFTWGTPTPLRGPDQSGVGPIGGMGLLFRTSNQTNEIQIWQASTVILRGQPYYQGIGSAPLPAPPFRFRVEVNAAAFGGGSPALVRALVNGTPIRLSPGAADEFVWVKTNGFGGGYFTLSAFAQAPGQWDSIFDNVRVFALPSIWPSRSTVTTIAGRSNQTFSVVVPPTLVATNPVTVVLANANPGVATLAGETGGALTLTFPAGGANVRSVTVIGHAAGETTFTLSTTAGVPIGGRPVSVKVIGLPLHIANPSFEEPPIPGLPGFGAIPGWDVSDINSVGVSPNLEIGGSLANNSRSTDGSYVALLRSVPNLFANEQMIGTTIANLVPGQKYELSFQANARVGGAAARMDVLLDGTAVLATQIAPVDNGVALPYKPLSLVLTPTAFTVTLAIANQSPGSAEATVFVDGFTVKPLTPGRWSIAPWTGDEDSGIQDTNTYTHAFNFGRAGDIAVNGVTFVGVAGANPAVAGKFVTANYPSTLQNSANNNLTGQSSLLAGDFIYGGQQPQLTLQGLIPGAQYRLTLFGGGWADTQPGQRLCTWMGGGESLTVDENTYGTGNGLRVHYDFLASGTEETIEGRVLGPGTYHTFAFANQLVAQPVRLRITQVSPTQVRIAWPAAAAGYVLQSSSAVAGGYTNVAVTPGLEGDEQVVYQPISGTRFYRLVKP